MATCILLSSALVSTLARAKELKPTTFRAQYSREIDADEVSSVKACAIAGQVATKDARSETAVGDRARDKTPEIKQAITMTGDVGDWVRAGFSEIARLALLKTAVPSRPEVTVAVANIWIEESVHFNAVYEGRVVLDVSVNPPGGGASCWSERVDGSAENYGRPGKEVNYQETVNHALDRAVAKTFSTTDFVDALCSCAPTP